MKIYSLKLCKKGLQLSVVLLIAACTSPDVSFDSKPIDYKSAKNLAQTLADAAHCGNFEDMSYQDEISFSCQMSINGENDATFKIYIFYDTASRYKLVKEICLAEKEKLFKLGPYYLISKFQSFSDEASTIEIPTTAKDFVSFPGELSNSSKSKQTR